MSVTFYDRDNPSEWNHEEGTIIAGGPEANFSNVNAGWILQVLGYPVNDSSDLIGEVSAQELDNRINKRCFKMHTFVNNFRLYYAKSFD